MWNLNWIECLKGISLIESLIRGWVICVIFYWFEVSC